MSDLFHAGYGVVLKDSQYVRIPLVARNILMQYGLRLDFDIVIMPGLRLYPIMDIDKWDVIKSRLDKHNVEYKLVEIRCIEVKNL